MEFTYLTTPRIFRGSPLYPLPPDYNSLTEDGKRLARVNACSLQRAVRDNVQRSRLAVDSFTFFREYYLKPRETMFFDLTMDQDEPLPSPPFHSTMVEYMYRYATLLFGAPRGAAKSYNIDMFVLHTIYTNINTYLSLMLAKGSMLPVRFDRYKQQILHNQRLNDDFGSLKPPPREGAFNSLGLFILSNRCRIQGWSVEGRQRGDRPHWALLDDPEYDPESSATDMEEIRAQFAIKIFRVIMPMMRDGTRLTWTGTMISKQHLMWQAYHADDPRFGEWMRVMLPAILEDGTPLWPEWKDEEDIESLRRKMGHEVDGEYFNMPGESTKATFPPPKYYNIGTMDQEISEGDPIQSSSVIMLDDIEPIDPMTWFRRLKVRVTAVDAAASTLASSDFTAITTVGLDDSNLLWVLDCTIDRLEDREIEEEVWRQLVRWRCQYLALEDVAVQKSANQQIVTGFARRYHGLEIEPEIIMEGRSRRFSKTDRIMSALRWRSDNGLLVFPFERRLELGFSRLLQQYMDFRSEMRQGGLAYDDGLDSLATAGHAAKVRMAGRPPAEEDSWERRIDSGETTIMGVDFRAAMLSGPMSHLRARLERKYEEDTTNEQSDEWDSYGVDHVPL